VGIYGNVYACTGTHTLEARGLLLDIKAEMDVVNDMYISISMYMYIFRYMYICI